MLQCLICDYGYFLSNDICQKCPKICDGCNLEQNQLNPYCLDCKYPYKLINNQCQLCGYHCADCVENYDQKKQQYFLRCLRCQDDSNYFITNDAINCKFNEIPNCVYAFMIDINDYTQNTLDILFEPFELSDSVQTKCGRCKNQFLYDFQYNDCSLDFNYGSNCIYKRVVDWGFDVCLIGEQSKIQLTKGCQNSIPFCSQCINNSEKGKVECILCETGYFASRIFSNCLSCPEQFHCKTCYEQDKLRKDNWKQQIRAFYYNIITSYITDHDFTDYAQSQDFSDYEIICTECINGYFLKNTICIKQCPELCIECKLVNDENICIKCPMEVNHRILSLYNNQCITCPSNCNLCRVREDYEITEINPLFNSNEFKEFSYQCVSFTQPNYYYNSYFGQFMNQLTDQTKAFHQIEIQLELICSEDYYISQIIDLSEDQIYTYNQSHVLLSDLANLPHYYNSRFYKIANEQQIVQIVLKVTSNIDQVCLLENDLSINQQFSNNIFTAMQQFIQFSDIQLDMSGQFTTFLIQSSFKIINFSKISISDFYMKFIGKANVNFIIESIFQQSILLSQLNISSEEETNFYYKFDNVSDLSMSSINLSNILIKSQNVASTLFVLNFIDQNNTCISIKNLNIISSSFFNTIIFFIFGHNLSLQLTNISLNGTFNQSLLFQQNINDPWHLLNLSEVNIIAQFTNCINFFGFKNYKNMIIRQVVISYSYIFASQLFIINNNNPIIENFMFSKNSLQNKSIMLYYIEESYMLESEIAVMNFQFVDNIYDQFSNFIKIMSSSQKVLIENLQLVRNQIFTEQIINQTLRYELSLIEIQASYIQILRLFLLRGNGLTEFKLSNSQFLLIQNFEIQTSEKYLFKGIHQYLDCWVNNVPLDQYGIVLNIYNIKVIEVCNFILYNLITINDPIIYIESISTSIIKQNEQIMMYNGQFKQNLQILTKKETHAPIIEIKSEQNLSIVLDNLQFYSNLMHDYNNKDTFLSSSILNFDCFKCKLLMNQLIFENNLIINSTNTLFKLSVEEVKIEFSTFTNSCMLNYQTLYPYLLWGYELNSEIFFENLEFIFQTKCQAAIGIMEAKLIYLNQIQILNAFGQEAGFIFNFQYDGLVSISYSKFENIILAQKQNSDSISKGGCFQIYSKSHLCVDIINVNFSNISSYVSSCVLSIEDNNQNLQVFLKQITLRDCFSFQGDLLYRKINIYHLKQQKFLINQIQFFNSIEGLQLYFKRFYTFAQNDYLSQELFLEYFLNQRSKLFLMGGKLNLDQMIIEGLIFESILYGYNFENLGISNLFVRNGNLFHQGLIQVFNEGFSNQISFSKFLFQNLSQEIQYFDIFFEQSKTQNGERKFTISQQICNNVFNNEYAPQNLQTYYSEQYYYNLINQIWIEIKISQSEQQINALVFIKNSTFNTNIKLNYLQFSQILCPQCYEGLLFIYFAEQPNNQLVINQLTIKNNDCGIFSCFVISKDSMFQQNLPLNRILKQNIESQLYQIFQKQIQYEIQIESMNCQSNKANFGTCLFIYYQNTLIKNSIMILNQASFEGGAIYFYGQNKLLTILNSYIAKNSAQKGGAIFTVNSTLQNYTTMQTYLEMNKAKEYGNDFFSNPTHISITLNNYKSILQIQTVLETKSQMIEEVIMLNKYIYKKIEVNLVYLPSGQQISKFQKFNTKSRSYEPLNQTCRLVILNNFYEKYYNLPNTQCFIQGRKFNLTLDEDYQESFNNYYTNIQKVSFNSSSNDYNLDNLILYFDHNYGEEIILQLQFKCERIIIPVFENVFPYRIEKYHNNYSLIVNVKTFPCQYGEIRNVTTSACQICDINQDQYQLVLNQSRCYVKDQIAIKEIQPAQINLYSGYWRPYFESNQIEYCYNLPQSCLGGWFEGDLSCVIGHTGALCEQCDIRNIRGDGYFSVSGLYQCGSCVDYYLNLYAIIGISIWTMISIFFSVKNTLEVVIDELLIVKLRKGGMRILPKALDKGLLTKFLTNYLQIIVTLTTFRLQIPPNLTITLNSGGNPIKTLIYSLDCFLVNLNELVELHYLRMIWSILMPLAYIFIFLGFYGFGITIRLFKYHFSVISTTLIYMYVILSPNLIEGLIKLISSRTISGYQWISIDVQYRYDTQEHSKWIKYFCLPFLIFFSLIIPLIFKIGLYLNKNNFNSNDSRMNWGYLYNEFKPTAYFWEIIKILQKEFIIIILAYFESYIVIKAVLIYVIIFTYQYLILEYKPYQSSNLNSLDYQLMQVCGLSIIFGIGLYVTQLIVITYVFYGGLIYINLKFLVLLVKTLLKAHLVELNLILESKCEKINIYFNSKGFNKKIEYLSKEKKKQIIQKKIQSIKKSIFKVAKAIKQRRTEVVREAIQEQINLDELQRKFSEEIKEIATKHDVSIFSRQLHSPNLLNDFRKYSGNKACVFPDKNQTEEDSQF